MMKLSCAHLATSEMRWGRFLVHFCPCAGRVRGARARGTVPGAFLRARCKGTRFLVHFCVGDSPLVHAPQTSDFWPLTSVFLVGC